MVAVIGVIAFGPRLPEVARTVGRYLAHIRRTADELKAEFEAGISEFRDDFEVDDEPETPGPSVPDAADEAPRGDDRAAGDFPDGAARRQHNGRTGA